MKETSVNNNLRLVQVFLSQSQTPGPGIFEVSTNDEGALFCTCPGFSGRKTCKHTKLVQTRIDNNHGSYPLEILRKATQEEAEQAKLSDEGYRSFIIRYGKIEVF
jgi:hypothetical protein